MEADSNPFPHIELVPFPRLVKVAKAVGSFLFRMPRPLSTHGSHFTESPLDSPLASVTELPHQEEFTYPDKEDGAS